MACLLSWLIAFSHMYEEYFGLPQPRPITISYFLPIPTGSLLFLARFPFHRKSIYLPLSLPLPLFGDPTEFH